MSKPNSVEQFRSTQQTRINTFLEQQLNNFAANSSQLKKAVEYTLLSGGKRIRPIMVYAIADMIGANINAADYIAGSIEMIHTYSLVHDDLPAMDNDALRRGKPTCHIQFDEATAILAGDALQAMAFELLSHTPCHSQTTIKLIQKLTHACGMNGMAGGQSLDLEAEKKPVSLTELENIHRLKTGALLSSCIEMTVLLMPDLDPSLQKSLIHFARHFGISFQIIDDILDITADTNTLGKPVGSDTINNKSTYPKLLGLNEAKNRAQEHIKKGKSFLRQTQLSTEILFGLCQQMLERTY